MSGFDTVIVVDWSGGNDRGARPVKDAIWACVARGGQAEAPVYLRNRQVAEGWLVEALQAERSAGRRVLAGFDFPFGYPAGFARAVCGADDPLEFWDWLEARVEDTPKANNRFDLAGAINAGFPGIGPFWGNGLAREIDHLPRKGRARTDCGLAERRIAETRASGAFPVWQLSGAGAVGSQVLMGLPVLARLRHRFGADLAVWPFQPLDAAIALVEVWPSLVVKGVPPEGVIRDAHQVETLARRLSALPTPDLDRLLDAGMPDAARCQEGWILGLGHEALLAPRLSPPRLSNDCFALPPGHHWTPVEQAWTMLRDRLGPIVSSETVPVRAALDRVLATPVSALRSHPPAANAAVDGYGFAHAATGTGPQVLPLHPGRSAAGAPFAGAVPHGRALRVLTGAILPEGVDTMVLQEDVTLGEGHVAFQGPVRRGANTRKPGEDSKAGAQVLAAGQRLRPQDLALAASVGVAGVQVFRPLRIGVLSTGSELAAPGTVAPPHQVYDANRPMLLSLAARWGAQAVDLGPVPDDRAALAACLSEAATRCDMVLTSGGASAGDEDHVSALLSETGSMALWRIAIKPGRPLALGVWDGVPVFGLPGNPVAAFVCALLFAWPAAGLLSGQGWRTPQGWTVPAAFAKSKKPGRTEYLRARLDAEGRAEVFASEGSGRISGLSWATGLVELGMEGRDIGPGDPVRFLPFSGFGL